MCFNSHLAEAERKLEDMRAQAADEVLPHVVMPDGLVRQFYSQLYSNTVSFTAIQQCTLSKDVVIFLYSQLHNLKVSFTAR